MLPAAVLQPRTHARTIDTKRFPRHLKHLVKKVRNSRPATLSVVPPSSLITLQQYSVFYTIPNSTVTKKETITAATAAAAATAHVCEKYAMKLRVLMRATLRHTTLVQKYSEVCRLATYWSYPKTRKGSLADAAAAAAAVEAPILTCI